MCHCTPEDVSTPYCGAADCHPAGDPLHLDELFQIPAQSDGCRHLRIDIAKSIKKMEDTNRWMLHLKAQCANPKCRAPFLFQGLPAGLNLEGATTDITGRVGQFALMPEGEKAIPRPGAPTGFSFPPPKDPL